MNYWVLILAISVFLGFHLADAEEPCRCSKIKCGPCEVDTGEMNFVKMPCGKRGKRTKSCARPVCTQGDPMPATCAKSEVSNSNLKMKMESEAKKAQALEAQSVPRHLRKKSVGVVLVAHGNAWVYRASGEKLKARVGRKVFEGDVLETSVSGKLKIVFHDQNRLLVTPDSRIEIKKQEYKKKGNVRKSLYKLLYGKIRSQVEREYQRKANYYQIKTPAAVAGVRGTDFVTTYTRSSGETRVDTLKGMVELSGIGSSKKILIRSGRYASYVVPERQEGGIFGNKNISGFVDRGKLTPVYKMSKTDRKTLQLETGGIVNREIASAHKAGDDNICSSPVGDFNECAWTCVNNPKGASTCRTDLKEVFCRRKRCNASGKWAEETRLPASEQNQCEPNRIVVAPCDY